MTTFGASACPSQVTIWGTRPSHAGQVLAGAIPPGVVAAQSLDEVVFEATDASDIQIAPGASIAIQAQALRQPFLADAHNLRAWLEEPLIPWAVVLTAELCSYLSYSASK